MYVIREKLSKKVLHIDYSLSAEPINGKEIYPNFDPKAMEIGRTERRYIPAHFNISETDKIEDLTLKQQIAEGFYTVDPYRKIVGHEIVPKALEELIDEGILSLEEIKRDLIENLSLLTFQKRRELIPDYKLINASIGLYDKREISNLRATVKSFRDEFYRIKAQIDESKNLQEIEAIEPRYPVRIVSAEKESGND
ncbi:hypothetical protein KA005_16360 [bacterium]|nr:hypothetical protein [bacterium]